MNRRRFLLSATGAAGAAALPLAARAQFNGRFQQPLTIAVNAPLSGSGAQGGREIANGVQGAIDETNRVGGTFGTAFQMRTFDDMDALAQSIVNVQFAAADSTVVAMVGGYDGSLLAASLQSYANEQMPLLVAGSTADQVTARGYRNVWRLPAKDSVEGQLAADFLARREHPKLVIAVAQEGDYGPDVAQGFVNGAKASKLNALAYLFPYDKPDYRAAASALAQKQPDYVYLCGVTASLGPLIPALRAAGYKGKFGASQGFYNGAALQAYGQDLAGGIISTSAPPLERAPDFANALADFRRGYAVTTLSAFGYAAAQIVISAVRRTGATSRLATMTALQAPVQYNTMAGPFQFTYSGDAIDPLVYFYTVTGGKLRFIAPSHVTSFVL
ncbi:MAG: branched-chain amino acid ABC transporter substrate-binding protein [Candidatus Baltobacteraceae bacterium]